MSKIFLSHSSADKGYVGYIAEHFGKDRCVYDTMCFDAGMKAIDEIFRELGNSSILCFFISDTSLNSEWVQRELAEAEESLHHDSSKLSQIFPIIIDPMITHADPRIPQFLKKGFGSYNLRYIASNIVACRKIEAQQRKQLLSSNSYYRKKHNTFYGRHNEISEFKDHFDAGQEIKCVVASGISGIGRREFIVHCLRNSQLIEEYYEPVVISLGRRDSIEDLLIRLSEVGYGNISLENLRDYPDMSSKIEVLIEIMSKVQNYKEMVVIYDDGCLINRYGDLAYWFQNALDRIRPEVTVAIAATYRVSETYCRKHRSIFSVELSPLTYPEWNGLMRVYAYSQDIILDSDDRAYFRNVINGYPPQVLFCVDRIRETSLDYVKKNSYELVERFSSNTADLLRAAIPEEFSKEGYGLLAFMSEYGVIPTLLVDEVLSLNQIYKDIFITFKSLTICRHLGSVHEYIEVNPVISDYIQRNRFELPLDIEKLLREKIEAFNTKINGQKGIGDEDFENVRFYLKENLIDNKEVPERFMYSSLYLSAIYELYNRQKYQYVISIVNRLKSTDVFTSYDRPAKDKIQEFYCKALARECNDDFYAQVEYFRHEDPVLFDFLRGFMFRNIGNYSNALLCYKQVLGKRPMHRSAMREIVIVYRGLGEYNSSCEYAKQNYLDEPNNLYHIQPYFEIIVRKTGVITDEELRHLEMMRSTLHRINESKPISDYYELEAQYASFIERDVRRAKALLKTARELFPNSSYIERSYFDCCESHGDIRGMTESLTKLKALSSEAVSIMIAYRMREPILMAYQGKPIELIELCINQITEITIEAKKKLLEKVRHIQRR